MLNETEINLGRLVYWVGVVLSGAILVINLFDYIPGMGCIGIAVLAVTCTHAIIRSIHSHDNALREAFDHGRQHGKLQAVADLKDRERI